MDKSIDDMLNSLLAEIKKEPEKVPESFGLVLAGGGGKGAYEIGALVALKELGVLDKVTVVSGNSIGTVNMALLAGGDLDRAREIWENINPDDFIALDENGFDITKEGEGIFSREGLKRIIAENTDLDKMSNSEVKYYITACTKDSDGNTKVNYILQNGKPKEVIEQYVMASSAIPVLYDYVRVEGLDWFDGGMCDNTPIKPVYDEGMRDIIVISLNNNYKDESHLFEGANIINIIPSHSLELDSILGTVDLSKQNSVYRYKLGYLDAKMIIKAMLDGTPVPSLAGNHVIAQQDLNRNKLQSSVNDNMAGLARILGTTDFL